MSLDSNEPACAGFISYIFYVLKNKLRYLNLLKT